MVADSVRVNGIAYEGGQISVFFFGVFVYEGEQILNFKFRMNVKVKPFEMLHFDIRHCVFEILYCPGYQGSSPT